MSNETEYELSEQAVSWLAGAVQFDPALRREAIAKMVDRHGIEAMVDAFSGFIGLANSVASNCRDFLETAAIIHGDLGPYEAEKINCPTIFGALMGVRLAKYGCGDACVGCAFRLGTEANQSATTTADAEWCSHPGEQPFMCHEDLDDQGQPTKVCQGWIRMRHARKKAAA